MGAFILANYNHLEEEFLGAGARRVTLPPPGPTGGSWLVFGDAFGCHTRVGGVCCWNLLVEATDGVDHSATRRAAPPAPPQHRIKSAKSDKPYFRGNLENTTSLSLKALHNWEEYIKENLAGGNQLRSRDILTLPFARRD